MKGLENQAQDDGHLSKSFWRNIPSSQFTGVVALNRIMCSNELDVKDSDVLKYSMSFSTAIKYVGFLEEKTVHEQEYSSNSRILSSNMIKKLVQCGIVPNVLASLNRQFGYRGVVCYLYTKKESKAPRITNKVSILTEIARIAYRLDRKYLIL